MQWDVLADYAKAVRSVRLGRARPAEPDAVPVVVAQVAAYRQRVSHLVGRLPPDAFDRAAYGGLQDSSPRAAVMALHARMNGVRPDTWEDPALAQIWFRWADYVVPRSALPAFTVGAAPRDERHRRALDEFADAVLDVLAGQRGRQRTVGEAFPDRPEAGMLLRCLSVTAKVHIRWDARSCEVVPATPPDVDPREARLELARRFLHWYGPVDHLQFAKLSGVCVSDAERTWAELRGELTPVSLEGTGRWMLSTDVPALRKQPPVPNAVRLIPGGGDPYLQLDRGTVVPEPPADLGHRHLAAGGSRSVVNGLTGRILLDGNIVGSWGRAGTGVRIAPWAPLRPAQAELIEREATSLTGPLGREPRLSWIE